MYPLEAFTGDRKTNCDKLRPMCDDITKIPRNMRFKCKKNYEGVCSDMDYYRQAGQQQEKTLVIDDQGKIDQQKIARDKITQDCDDLYKKCTIQSTEPECLNFADNCKGYDALRDDAPAKVLKLAPEWNKSLCMSRNSGCSGGGADVGKSTCKNFASKCIKPNWNMTLCDEMKGICSANGTNTESLGCINYKECADFVPDTPEVVTTEVDTPEVVTTEVDTPEVVTTEVVTTEVVNVPEIKTKTKEVGCPSKYFDRECKAWNIGSFAVGASCLFLLLFVIVIQIFGWQRYHVKQRNNQEMQSF